MMLQMLQCEACVYFPPRYKIVVVLMESAKKRDMYVCGPCAAMSVVTMTASLEAEQAEQKEGGEEG
jgi:hypothetical protein